MSKLMINKSGRIDTEKNWRQVVEDLWASIHSDKKDAAKFPRPVDAWERFVRTQQLSFIGDDNENINNNGFNGMLS